MNALRTSRFVVTCAKSQHRVRVGAGCVKEWPQASRALPPGRATGAEALQQLHHTCTGCPDPPGPKL